MSLLGTGQVLTLKYLLRRGLDVSLESGSVETAVTGPDARGAIIVTGAWILTSGA